MPAMNYQDAWSFLDRLQFFKIKLGLVSMNLFLETLNNPHHAVPFIHIAGTNGKGSVAATLHAILSAAGYRVGLYTSPHLSSVRERFRINEDFIPEEDFARQAGRIVDILNGRQITYFEFATALAMLWFADRRVDLAILEVGLGGRLDATNVVTPMVSVITNVSMDHEQYLGSTIRQIAAEKAGIIKPGVPVVAGIKDKDALAVIAEAAEGSNSPLYLLGRDFSGTRLSAGDWHWTYNGIETPGRYTGLPLKIKGEHQVDNAALALAALETVAVRFGVDEIHIRRGLENVRWPGRLEDFWIGGENPVHVLLDGAHNPDGARSLKNALLNDFGYDRLFLVWGSMADKDIRGTLLEIAPLARRIIFTRAEAERSARPDDMVRLLPEQLRSRASCTASVPEAIELAGNMCGPDDMLCIAGSLYLVGRARQLLRGEVVDGA
jgi:dihydrofolate synthase / folylpolyglutamate synthase